MVLNAQTISSNIDEAPRTITILGSTGSVGVSTVDLLMRNSNNYLVDTLTANQNVALLAKQAEQLNAKNVVIALHSCLSIALNCQKMLTMCDNVMEIRNRINIIIILKQPCCKRTKTRNMINNKNM